MSHTIPLVAGTLRIDIHRATLPLNYLLDFASRINPKRGYLFVSKVLGKHVPCQPAIMRDIYNRLAAPLEKVEGPVICIGMAETATGLGAGVADSLARKAARKDIVFQHTTRHTLTVPEWIRFDEVHSHAPSHILYRPLATLQQRFTEAQTLILVDDEISTGRTLEQLGCKLVQSLPSIREIFLVSIVNWLSQERRQSLQENMARAVSFISLLEGEFSFHPNSKFKPTPLGNREILGSAKAAQPQSGRCGLVVGEETLTHIGPYPKARKVSIVGTGEFQFQPFLWAEWLEKKGFDVLFQSTTRSPIQLGGPICGSLGFKDEYGEGVDNYLHNPPQPDREIIIAYETADLAQNHSLPARLGGRVWGLA